MPSADAAITRQRMEALRLAELALRQGDAAACIAALLALAGEAQDDPRLLQEIASRLAALGRHEDAERCSARALALCPDDPEYLYNHATALIALGRLDEAEAALDAVIAKAPGDGDAWYNRATLRKQTPARNHVDALRAQCEATPVASPMQVPLHYALAKELEDLGEYAAAFAALKQGADARRRGLSYRVEDDVATMRLIADAFDAGFFARKHAGCEDARPLFVVGLPRSGTTLVDRILGSHSRVTSRGESTDLAMALMQCAGPASGKAELVRKSTTLDFRALGERYCAHLSDGGALRQIDKTPLNILYLGIVAAALPQARIVHLRRNPMDACHAMYKTLFRMGYPFSYDLDDLARYWLAYDALMAHWRKLLPTERFLEVDYEDLVANQEAVSRRLVAHAGLDWEDACLQFERNQQASLTASAAQVRQPMYRSSVGLWRRYESELAPLAEALRAAGIDIEDKAVS
ncbi:sulfotransferase [Thermomonas brevis]|uniref:Sulfotransferase n=1 Tax=Thermomonas brevis TaxID=215691 RepID=A0A7G9QPD7_9GAMM|nr:sulfotransferase [Thermomonas brevis]QNN45212.1 sulfotransferase [Thermomonas brevis]